MKDFIEVSDTQGITVLINTSEVKTVKGHSYRGGCRILMKDGDEIETFDSVEGIKQKIHASQMLLDAY